MDDFSHLPPYLADTVRKCVQLAREKIGAGQDLQATALLGQCDGDVLEEIPYDTSSIAAKLTSRQHVQHAAAILKADFVLVLMEGWALPADKVAQRKAILDKYGAISNYPGKLDVLHVTLETREGLFAATARIKPKGISKVKRIFEALAFHEYRAEGTMAGLLVPDDDAPAPMSPRSRLQ